MISSLLLLFILTEIITDFFISILFPKIIQLKNMIAIYPTAKDDWAKI